MTARRQARIALLREALEARRVLRLREAAALTGASEMTIRRDVDAHPQYFTYLGGHIVSAESVGGAPGYQLEAEAGSHSAAKTAACAHAAKLLRPDTTIFIDCGTTLAPLADMIPDEFPLTAICYSLNIAQRLVRKPQVRLIVLGGLYYPASASFSGEGGEPLKDYGVDQAFLSAGGVDQRRGASCSHLHEVAVKRQALRCALESHLVVDTSKLGRVRPMVFSALSEFRSLITEDGPSSPTH